jgi:hypothetical protein
MAKSMYRDHSKAMFYDGFSHAQNTELKLRHDTIMGNQDRNLNGSANALINTPSVSRAYESQDDLLHALKQQQVALRIPPDEMAARESAIKKGIASSLFKGYEAQVAGNPVDADGASTRLKIINGALDILYGRDTDSTRRGGAKLETFTSSMSPDDKAAAIEKFERLKKEGSSREIGDFESWSHSVTIQALSSEGITTGQMEKLSKKAMELVDNPSIAIGDLERVVKAKHSVDAAKAAADKMKEPDFAGKPLNDQVAEIEGISEGLHNKIIGQMSPENQDRFRHLGTEARQEIRHHLTVQVQRAEKEFKTDPVIWGQQYPKNKKEIADSTAILNAATTPEAMESPEYKKALQTRSQALDDASREHSGNASAMYLSKGEVAQQAAIFKDEKTSYQERRRRLDAMYNADPDRYIRNVTQLIKQGGLSPSYYVALAIDDPELSPVMDEWTEAIVNEGKYPNAEGMLKVHGTSIEMVKGEIEKNGLELFENIVSRSGTQVGRLEKQAYIDTAFTMVMKKVQEGKSPTSAISEMTKQFLKLRHDYKVPDTDGFFSSSGNNIVVPLRYNKRELTQTEQDNLISNLKKIKKGINSFQGGTLPNRLPPKLGLKWNEFLEIPANTKLQLDESRGVYNIMWYDTEKGEWYALMNKDKGAVIEIPIRDLIKPTYTPPSIFSKIVSGAGNAAAKAAKKAGEAVVESGKLRKGKSVLDQGKF